LAEDAASGVDFLDGDLDAVTPVRAGRGAGARKLGDHGDLGCVLSLHCGCTHQQRGAQCQNNTAVHSTSLDATATCAVSLLRHRGSKDLSRRLTASMSHIHALRRKMRLTNREGCAGSP